MAKKEQKLKKKKKKTLNLKNLFADKKKRYLFTFLLMVPFIIGIIVFSITTIRQINSIRNMVAGDVVAELKNENVISSMNYILRDDATDLQKEYFAELKSAVEEGNVNGEPADDAKIAELVAKNFIADFYTWTNKRGQYDIGGFYYIYDGEFENGDHFKENTFLKARDGFYKYLSYYATQYGKENLLEVTDINIQSCQKMASPYVINEHVENRQDEQGEWYDYREDFGYEAYVVKANWNYNENTKLNLSQFANSINLVVINNVNMERFEIVEASENTINGRTGQEEKEPAEEGAEGGEGSSSAAGQTD